MSLSVHVYSLDEEGHKHFLRSVDWKEVGRAWHAQGLSPEGRIREAQRLRAENEHWRHPAGPEAWRTEVYGSKIARSLGLELLPSLAAGDLDVTGERLDRLAEETQVLVRNIGLVARDVGQPADSILPRLRNISSAVAEAKELGGGVVIW